MKKPATTREQKKTLIEQLSQAEVVEMVLGLQKIIEELPEKLAIATGKSRSTSQVSVIQTCRFQARSVMTFFREAISAHSFNLAVPELIPLFQT